MPRDKSRAGDHGEEIWMTMGNQPGAITKELELVSWDFSFRASERNAIWARLKKQSPRKT